MTLRSRTTDLATNRRLPRRQSPSLRASAVSERLKGGPMALRHCFVLGFLIAGGTAAVRGASDSGPTPNGIAPRPVSFAREVRPILSEHCFACHGPDDAKRKAGLRLDSKEGAFARLEDGDLAIVPKKPDESDLIFRIESDDANLRMPPRKGRQAACQPSRSPCCGAGSSKGLPGRRTGPSNRRRSLRFPPVKKSGWRYSEIDRFILARLERRGTFPLARGRQADLDPPRHARPDRAAALSPGCGRLPGGFIPGGL